MLIIKAKKNLSASSHFHQRQKRRNPSFSQVQTGSLFSPNATTMLMWTIFAVSSLACSWPNSIQPILFVSTRHLYQQYNLLAERLMQNRISFHIILIISQMLFTRYAMLFEIYTRPLHVETSLRGFRNYWDTTLPTFITLSVFRIKHPLHFLSSAPKKLLITWTFTRLSTF